MPNFIGGVPFSHIQNGTSVFGNWISEKWNNSSLGEKVNAIPVGDSNVGNLVSSAKSYLKDKSDEMMTPQLVKLVSEPFRIGAENFKALDDTIAQKPSVSSGNSAYKVYNAPIAPQTVDYLNAELAKHYGMNSSTAYQEALSNTAYQRAVKDMKAAGLNPAAIFGSGKGFTAGGVGYASSGDSGYSGTGFGYGSSSKNGKLFSEGAYHAISTAVGLAGMAALKKGPIGYYISETAAKSVMGALNEIFS